MGKPLTLVVAIAWVMLTGVIDYVTGYEIRLFPLYFLPVAFVAWNMPRNVVLALAALSSATWAYSNWLAGRVYSSLFIWPINIASQFIAFAAVGILVAELRRRLMLEQGMSRSDPLTALLNRHAFYERGAMLLAIARRSARPLTLAYMDLDDFKQVNNERGHQEGDRALNQAAEVLRGHFRSSDLVARLGGDEFAILLVDTGPDAARLSLDRLRDVMAEAMQRGGWPVTVSVGAVCFLRAPQTIEEAIHEADVLMYQAKKSGKNRVHIDVVDSRSRTTPMIGDEPNPSSRV